MQNRILSLCALLGLFFAGLPKNLNAQEETLNLGRKDVIFLIDGSDNTGASGIAHIRDFIVNTVQQLDVQPDQVRVGVVQYADRVKTEFSLNSHNNKAAVLSAVRRIRQMGGRSSDLADAINYVMQNELKPSAGVRPAEASQHLVVLTGGRSPQDVAILGPLLKSSRVNCIGIGASGADTRQLAQIATSTEDVIQVPTFPSLPAIREKFISRLRGRIEDIPTEISPGGAVKKADIVFLVDGSINVGKSNFGEVMNFVINLIDLFYNERDELRFALAHHATDVTDVFFLNSYKNKDDIISAIGRAEYKGGRRINTGAAIRHVQDKHFIKEKGSRKDEGTPQILILITGGRSADDSKAAALALKKTGVRIFALGVGDILGELENLASEPATLASASTYFELSELNEQILEALDDEVKGKPMCNDALNIGPRDIIFLLDTTMGATLLSSTREFIQHFVNTMPIGPCQVQVGVAQFNTSAWVELDLNTHGSREALVAALGRLRSRPGSTINIGAALDFVRTNMLRSDKGSRLRQGVPQLVLLMTTKRSGDAADEAARALRQMGVLTLAAGSKAADENELRRIAFTDAMVFMLRDLRQLLRNPGSIVGVLSSLSGMEATERPTETGA